MPAFLFQISPVRLLLAAFALLPVLALCQEPEGEGEEKSPILLRVLCKQPVPGADDLKIVREGKILHELVVTPSLMTEPLGVGRGKLLLARTKVDGDVITYDPVVELTIPAAGKRFVLALFPALKPTPEKPYLHQLVRTDGLRFETSDLYLFNLTDVTIGGTLGKTKFSIAPSKSSVVTPDPLQAGERMYQSRFYYRQEGEVRIFNDTRWPLAKSARVYLFFVPDPRRRSIGYQSFREYTPFP